MRNPAVPIQNKTINGQRGNIFLLFSTHNETPMMYKNAKIPKMSKNSGGNIFYPPPPRKAGLRRDVVHNIVCHGAIGISRYLKIFNFINIEDPRFSKGKSGEPIAFRACSVTNLLCTL